MKSAWKLIMCMLCLPLWSMAQGDNPNSPQIRAIGDDHVINCTSSPVGIGVEVKNWVPGFSYAWDNGRTDSVIQVKPSVTTVYTITVSNPTINYTSVRSIEVKVFNAPVSALDERIDIDKHTCPGRTMALAVDPSGGYPPFDYYWSNGAEIAHPLVQPTENTTYDVTITDQCGSSTTAQVLVEFEPHDPLVAPPVQSVSFQCGGEELTLQPKLSEVSGGVGHGYAYTFSTWDKKNQPLHIEPGHGDEVTYTVTDACGFQVANAAIKLVEEAPEVPSPEAVTACKQEEVTITDREDGYYYWDGETMHTDFALAFDQSAEVSLVYIDACGESQTVNRRIEVEELDADFDLKVNHIDRQVMVLPYDNEQGLNYTWYVNGTKASSASRAEFTLLDGDQNDIGLEVTSENGCTAKSTRTVIFQDGVDIPTAFSPNGDGMNDQFKIQFEDDLQSFEIKIFDRWGQLIYASRDQYFEWDGKIDGKVSPLANYAYIIRATTLAGKEIEKRGTISTLTFE